MTTLEIERENLPRLHGSFTLDVPGLGALFEALARRGFDLIGPTRRNGAIVYDHIESVDDLPRGWTDVQNAATYRLEKREDDALFGYVVGPNSWKKYLHEPTIRLWGAQTKYAGFKPEPQSEPVRKMALIGVRSCELHAIAILDRVMLEGPYVDAAYRARREGLFIVAVNCAEGHNNCFCVSMDTGPKAKSGFDLALTEVVGNGSHYFVAEAGSERGLEVLNEIEPRQSTDDEEHSALAAVERASKQMGRTVETAGLKELLYDSYEHPRWDEVASRCLSCTNCTMVCPTCFCTSVEDHTGLTGQSAERVRKWDSCFTTDFAYIHGGSLRASPRARYRQWLTHKMATWQDQFGTFGCVGCGRCITWCPVGIDITEEVRAIRESRV